MDQELEVPQTTLRDTLETNFEAAEQGTLPDRMRDEVGRFAPKPKEEVAPPADQQKPEIKDPPWDGPTTWKKEYRPLYDKLRGGVSLTADEAKKIAEYAKQREGEFTAGVTTYKAEAEQAKHLQQSIQPFLPELQAHGVDVNNWIRAVGTAHVTLLRGTPEQKVELLRGLARGAGVPLEILASQVSGQTIAGHLMGQIQQLKGTVVGLMQEKKQQEEGSLKSHIEQFSGEKDAQGNLLHPHFQAVKQTMAQLLETKLASDLKSAYDNAVWMNPELRQQLAQPQAKPKAKPVLSVRSESPTSAGSAGPKDRRASLSQAFDEMGGRV